MTADSMPCFYRLKLPKGYDKIGSPVSKRARSPQVMAAGSEPAHVAADSGQSTDPDERYTFEAHQHPCSPTSISTSISVPGERLGVIDVVGSRRPEFVGSPSNIKGPGSIPSVVSPSTTRVTPDRRTAAQRPDDNVEGRIGGGRTLHFNDAEDVAWEEQTHQQEPQPRFPSRLRKALPHRSSSNVSIESEPVAIPGSTQPEQDTGLEEEGWSSFWENCTRLFPGTHGGCSPPRSESRRPPDSPLYFTPKNHSNATSAMVTPPPTRRYNSSNSMGRDGADGGETRNGHQGGKERFWGRQLSQMSLEDAEEPARLGGLRGKLSRGVSFEDRDSQHDQASEEDCCDGSTEDLDDSGGLMFDLEL